MQIRQLNILVTKIKLSNYNMIRTASVLSNDLASLGKVSWWSVTQKHFKKSFPDYTKQGSEKNSQTYHIPDEKSLKTLISQWDCTSSVRVRVFGLFRMDISIVSLLFELKIETLHNVCQPSLNFEQFQCKVEVVIKQFQGKNSRYNIISMRIECKWCRNKIFYQKLSTGRLCPNFLVHVNIFQKLFTRDL